MHQKGRDLGSARKIAIYLLILVGSAKLAFIIWQFYDGQFLVAPGGDPLNHISVIRQILQGNYKLDGYPPLFHYLIAGIVWLTGFSVISVLKVTAVVLLFTPVPILWWLANRLFGFWTAFWTTLFYLTVSTHPLLGFADGNYPDLLNYGVFFPLFVVFLINGLKSQPMRWGLISLIPLLLMISTHHLTASFILIIIVAFLMVTGLYYSHSQNKVARKNLLIIFGIYLAVSIPVGIVINRMFGDILTKALTSAKDFAPINSGMAYSVAPHYDALAPLLNPFVEYLGLIGLVMALSTIKKNTEPKILIIVWTVVLWLMSRTSLTSLPPRFLREINVPLVILSGYAITSVMARTASRKHKLVVSGLVGYLIYINLVQVSVGPFLLPDGFKDLVWYKPIDKEKVDYLIDTPQKDSTVLANPANPYIRYFLSQEGLKVKYVEVLDPPKFTRLMSEAQKQEIVKKYIIDNKARYIFIGSTPLANADERSFSEFNGNSAALDMFSHYKFETKDIVKEFSDGSKLVDVGKLK